jgi:hypothetical protein
MATRKRARTGGQLSKLSDKLAALAGSNCVASYIRDEHGDVFMILMADGCPVCLEAKRQLRERERSRATSTPPSPSRTPPSQTRTPRELCREACPTRARPLSSIGQSSPRDVGRAFTLMSCAASYPELAAVQGGP